MYDVGYYIGSFYLDQKFVLCYTYTYLDTFKRKVLRQSLFYWEFFKIFFKTAPMTDTILWHNLILQTFMSYNLWHMARLWDASLKKLIWVNIREQK